MFLDPAGLSSSLWEEGVEGGGFGEVHMLGGKRDLAGMTKKENKYIHYSVVGALIELYMQSAKNI